MKSSGFSITFCLAWLITVAAVIITVAMFGESAKGPAIIMAAEVLTIASVALLIIVPMILLSMLRNTRRSADYLQELVERQIINGAPKPSSKVIN